MPKKKKKKKWDPLAAYRKRARCRDHIPTQADVTVGQLRKALSKIRRDPRFKHGDYIALEFCVGSTLVLEATSMSYGKLSKSSLTGRKPLRVAAYTSNRSTVAQAVELFWKADARAREQWAAREERAGKREMKGVVPF